MAKISPSYFRLPRQWYDYAVAITTAKRRLAFYDQLFALAFDGVQPSDGELGQLVTTIVNGIADLTAKRRDAGRKGGIQSGISRNLHEANEANAKQNEAPTKQSEALLQPHEAKRSKKKRETERKEPKEREREQESTLAGATRTRARAGISDDLIRETGRKLGVPPEFTAYFAAEMDKLGWQSMKSDGRVYDVTPRNVAATLRNWWSVEKKNNPRAPSAVPADVPRGASCADDDATPDWVRAAGGAE